MSKFDQRAKTAGPTVTLTSPVHATGETQTHEGGAAYARDAKSDLFLLAVTNMVGEKTFYETAETRDARFVDLVRRVTLEDPVWMTGFIPWLRNTANMRSASLVAACEYVKARLDAGVVTGPSGRALISSALSRADEPAEVLAYWTQTHGRRIPKPIKRGVADALVRLMSEYSALKYDGQSRTWRVGDVIELTHPRPTTQSQSDLFKWLLDRRHDRGQIEVPSSLSMINARAELDALPIEMRRALVKTAAHDPDGAAAGQLKAAGHAWESLSGWLQGPMDKNAWTAMVPNMGYMALLRNLRNFDEAGVDDTVAARVAELLVNPEQIARSRQFPYRFFSAYRAAPSLRWGHALDRALTASTANIPAFAGRTLVLVDTSGSMTARPLSKHGTIVPMEAAAIFGVAMALRGNEVDLVGFANGDTPFRHDIARGASLLKTVEAFVRRSGDDGHGTQIERSLRKTYANHTRVVIVSDMQTMGDYHGVGPGGVVPASVPVYGFNLGGYASTVIKGGSANRHEFGGMNDATFTMIATLESRGSATWPWEMAG